MPYFPVRKARSYRRAGSASRRATTLGGKLGFRRRFSFGAVKKSSTSRSVVPRGAVNRWRAAVKKNSYRRRGGYGVKRTGGYFKFKRASCINQLNSGTRYSSFGGRRPAGLGSGLYRKITEALIPKVLYKSQSIGTFTDTGGWGSVSSFYMNNQGTVSQLVGLVQANNPQATQEIFTSASTPTTYSTSIQPPASLSAEVVPLIMHYWRDDFTFTNTSQFPLHMEIYITYPVRDVPYNISGGSHDPALQMLGSKAGQYSYGNSTYISNDGVNPSSLVVNTVQDSFGNQLNENINEYRNFGMYYKVLKRQTFELSAGTTIDFTYQYTPTMNHIPWTFIKDSGGNIENIARLTRVMLLKFYSHAIVRDVVNSTSNPSVTTIRYTRKSSVLCQQGWNKMTRTIESTTVVASASAGGASAAQQWVNPVVGDLDTNSSASV